MSAIDILTKLELIRRQEQADGRHRVATALDEAMSEIITLRGDIASLETKLSAQAGGSKASTR